MPDFLDLVGLDGEVPGQGEFGEAQRRADAQAAGDQLDQGDAGRDVARIEPGFDQRGDLGAGRRAQGGDEIGQAGRGLVPCRRPEQGDGLGEVADEIVGQREQLGIGAGGGQLAQHGGFGTRKVERAGDGGERVAALGIGAVDEIIGEECDLGVAAGGVEQAFQQVGEGFHSCSASSP